MQQFTNKGLANRMRPARILSGLALALALAAGQVKAQGRPLPRLDTSKGLYIRKDGTRVYKDPAPPTGHVYTWRRHNGTMAQQYTGARYTGSHPKPRRHVRAHGRRRHVRHY